MAPDDDTQDPPGPPDGAQDGQEGDQGASGGQDGAQDVQDGQDGAGGDPDPVVAARREAAGYRRRLRDAERDRDRLAELVGDYRRREVETLAATTMVAAGDLWVAGVTVDELLDDGGVVDEAKVRAAVTRVVADRPHWRRRQGNHDAGARTPAAPSGDFGEAIRRAAGGR